MIFLLFVFEGEGLEVIKFTRGKACDESGCEESCGCRHGNMTYKVYEKFTLGCQSCTCSEKGVIECSCNFEVKRKEIRDMTNEEMKRFAVISFFPFSLRLCFGMESGWFKVLTVIKGVV